jgi:CRISPR type I-E-associated protein CasB/Cse2
MEPEGKGTGTSATKQEIADIVLEWWENEIHDKSRQHQRAEIQRCADLHAVVFTPAFQKLRRSCLAKGFKPNDDYLALVAGVVGRIEDTSPQHPCKEMAASKGSGKGPPLLHPLRFERLVKTLDSQQTYRELIAVLPIMDFRANVATLANDLYWWGKGVDSKVRKRWYTEYYENVNLPEETK